MQRGSRKLRAPALELEDRLGLALHTLARLATLNPRRDYRILHEMEIREAAAAGLMKQSETLRPSGFPVSVREFRDERDPERYFIFLALIIKRSLALVATVV